MPNQAVPKFLDHIDGEVVQVAAGGVHGAAVGKAGELWTWGKASQGQLGHKDARKGYPNRVDALSGVKVRQFCAHGCWCPACIVVHRVTGAGVHDQCACPGHHHSARARIPVCFRSHRSFISQVVYVSCGHKHTVAVDADGTAWSFGANRDGQLGLGEEGSSRGENAPRRVEALVKAGKKVVGAACGSDFTLFLTSDGQIWATGSDTDGQLGQGQPTPGLEEPSLVRGLVGQKVVKLAAGDTHALCLTASGHVFAWGSNINGQLGVGDRASSAQPREVTALDEGELDGAAVEGIACGGGHSLALLNDGRILAFGRGRNGQLGSGQHLQSVAAYRTTPTEVDLEPAAGAGCSKVVAVAAGAEHSLALCERQ